MNTFLLACYICLQLSNVADVSLSALGKREMSCDQCLTSLFDKSELLSHLGTPDPLSLPLTETGLLTANPVLREALEERLMLELSRNPLKAQSQQKDEARSKATQTEQQTSIKNNYQEMVASTEATLKALHEKSAKEIQRKSEEVTRKIQQLTSEFGSFVVQQRQILLKELSSIKNRMSQATRDTTDRDILRNGARLMAGESLVSQNGHYKAIMQKNGQLVITDRNGNVLKKIGSDRSRVTRANHHLALQADGNLVIYNNNDLSPVWHSSTHNPVGGAGHVVKLEGTGQLVIFDKRGNRVWTSGDFATRPRSRSRLIYDL